MTPSTQHKLTRNCCIKSGGPPK